MSHTLLIIGACMVGVGFLFAYLSSLFEMLNGLRVAVKARDWKAAGTELIFSTIMLGLGVLGVSLVVKYFTGAY